MGLIAPSVSMNGTGRKLLMEQYLGAMASLEDAMTKVRETAPHSRDFVGRDSDYKQAREEHTERLQTLQAVFNELEAIALEVHNT